MGILTAEQVIENDQPHIQNASGKFVVTVNDAGPEGNAVVGLKEGSTIRWSWHIWVIKDYDPDATSKINANTGYVIMDRNLGATSTIPGDLNSNGYLYQWGRKDPFPGPADYTQANNTTSSKAIYDSSNNLLSEGSGTNGSGVKKTVVAATRNLANSIYNPLTFYY